MTHFLLFLAALAGAGVVGWCLHWPRAGCCDHCYDEGRADERAHQDDLAGLDSQVRAPADAEGYGAAHRSFPPEPPAHRTYDELSPEALGHEPPTIADDGLIDPYWMERQMTDLMMWATDRKVGLDRAAAGDFGDIEDILPAWAEVELVKESLVMT